MLSGLSPSASEKCLFLDQVLRENKHRPNRLTRCCTLFKSPGVKVLCVLYLHYNSHYNDMEIPGTKRFVPKGFEMDIT